jgi:nitrite reductase (NO-forming)/hydroxylamine reductase
VDYSDLDNLRIDVINSHKYLHDGFFDPTQRYFQIAANASDRIEVMDSVERKFVASIETGKKPHPGLGANWIDPKTRPEQAWKICYKVETDGPGLFIRTHPNSKYVWAGQTKHPEPAVQQTVVVLQEDRRDREENLRDQVSQGRRGAPGVQQGRHRGMDIRVGPRSG